MADFDKLLSEVLAELKKENPNPNDSSVLDLNLLIAETAARVCVKILSKYERQISEGSQ